MPKEAVQHDCTPYSDLSTHLWGFILTYTPGFKLPLVARGSLQQHAPEINIGFVFFTVCLTVGITYATGVSKNRDNKSVENCGPMLAFFAAYLTLIC